jgi:hypothetical protein
LQTKSITGADYLLRAGFVEAMWDKSCNSVDDFVAAKASYFNKPQQLSTNGPQQVQYQSLENNKFQQVSIGFGIWFGTRCSTRRSSRKPFKFNIQNISAIEPC